MNFEKVSNEFDEWLETNNIIQRSVDGFWGMMKNWREAHPDKFSEDFRVVSLELRTASIVKRESYKKPYNIHVDISFTVLFEEANKHWEPHIYAILFGRDGECFDDFLYT